MDGDGSSERTRGVGGPGTDPQVLDVVVERIVAGGNGFAHEPSGRVVLVEGGLPGDRVRVEVLKERPTLIEARVLDVLVPSDDRVRPPCPEHVRGCGGCDLQHAAAAAQPALKANIVRDALGRAVRRGDLDEIPVCSGEELPAWAYRTSVRFGVVDGRPAFHRRCSDDLLAIRSCAVAHPLVGELLAHGRFPDASEVSVRVGARTGERLVVVSPTVSPETVVPDDVRVIGTDELRRGRRAWYHEEVAGHRFRISARSFFQSGASGADALVEAVGRALGRREPDDRLVDLYGGVGLFAVAMGTRAPVVVERSASSTADARVNLEGRGATVVKVAAERWHPSAADLLVADPSRAGLGREGVRVASAPGARRIALVSCDVAALARDLVLFAGAGYRATCVELVDLFPGTHHVEAVTTLEPA